jgi:hypothetical protein
MSWWWSIMIFKRFNYYIDCKVDVINVLSAASLSLIDSTQIIRGRFLCVWLIEGRILYRLGRFWQLNVVKAQEQVQTKGNGAGFGPIYTTSNYCPKMFWDPHTIIKPDMLDKLIRTCSTQTWFELNFKRNIKRRVYLVWSSRSLKIV